MRILILGGGGMLGHKLVQGLRDEFDTWMTVRGAAAAYARYELLDSRKVVECVDVQNLTTVTDAIATVRPAALINCVGLIKQLPSASDPILSLRINSLLPHELHQVCRATGVRLIHFSTDCVFNGRKGMYTEEDPSDAEDLYGRTKFLGETAGAGALTIRSSVIGRELSTSSGLVEWFLAQPGPVVRGYTRAIYSGFTTQAMARIVRLVLLEHPELCGTVQISSTPINKYDLLTLVRQAYGKTVEIAPVDDVRIDRTLDSSRFRQLAAFVPPSWPEMINEMAADPAPYDEWKRNRTHLAQENVRK